MTTNRAHLNDIQHERFRFGTETAPTRKAGLDVEGARARVHLRQIGLISTRAVVASHRIASADPGLTETSAKLDSKLQIQAYATWHSDRTGHVHIETSPIRLVIPTRDSRDNCVPFFSFRNVVTSGCAQPPEDPEPTYNWDFFQLSVYSDDSNVNLINMQSWLYHVGYQSRSWARWNKSRFRYTYRV